MSIEQEIIVRLLLASFWGAIVGAEREYRGKAAGFRTTILISLGACIFTMMSVSIGGNGNPDRIASNIVTGLGFLCAGVIFRSDNHISGITTAASVWSVAAVSMAIGAGYYFVSLCGGVLILLILTVLMIFQRKIDFVSQHRILRICYKRTDNGYQRITALFDDHKISCKLIAQQRDNEYVTISWEIQGSKKSIDDLNEALLLDEIYSKVENM